MRPTIFLGLMLGLVPIQATLAQAAGDAGVRLDLCLVAVFLVGFLRGEVEGILIGIVLGFVQDLFSAGPLWINLMTKGGIGLVSGLLGRHLAHATAISVFSMVLVLSLLSSGIFAYSIYGGELLDELWRISQAFALPQAFFDAMVGALIYWMVSGRRQTEETFSQEIRLFGR